MKISLHSLKLCLVYCSLHSSTSSYQRRTAIGASPTAAHRASSPCRRGTSERLPSTAPAWRSLQHRDFLPSSHPRGSCHCANVGVQPCGVTTAAGWCGISAWRSGAAGRPASATPDQSSAGTSCPISRSLSSASRPSAAHCAVDVRPSGCSFTSAGGSIRRHGESSGSDNGKLSADSDIYTGSCRVAVH